MDSGSKSDHGTNLELCLDFVDTVDWRTSERPEDKLRSYDDLVAWSRRNKVLTENEAQRLIRKAAENENLAKKAMEEARRLRETIFRIFSATAHGREPETEDLETLNEHLAVSLSKSKLKVSGTSYSWTWRGEESASMMLWPIGRSAADLLTSEDLVRVKECANEEQGCGWLFLDCSVNQSRRWCSMDSCGNRVKFKKYYRERSSSKREKAHAEYRPGSKASLIRLR